MRTVMDGKSLPASSNLRARNHIGEAILEIYRSGDYSDLRVKCRGQEWTLHRNIILPRSQILSAKITCSSSAIWHLDLDDDEPNIVEHMIKFMYTSDYDDQDGDSNPSTASDEVNTPKGSKGSAVSEAPPQPTVSSGTQRSKDAAEFPRHSAVEEKQQTAPTVSSGEEDSQESELSQTPIQFGTPSTMPRRFARSPLGNVQQSPMRIFGTPSKDSKVQPEIFKTFGNISQAQTNCSSVFGSLLGGKQVLTEDTNPAGTFSFGSSENTLATSTIPFSPWLGKLGSFDVSSQHSTPQKAANVVDDSHAASTGVSPAYVSMESSDLCSVKNMSLDMKISGLSISCRSLVTNAKVYILAQKYGIDALKAVANSKYCNLVEQGWNSAAFVDSLRVLYEPLSAISEVDTLRRTAAIAAGRHAKELLGRDDFLDLLKHRGDLATAVLKASLG